MWIYIWDSNISGIYIWEWKDSYEAMQWPCPSGFHVPKNSEFSSLRTAMNSLWITTSNGNCCKTYLKMPFSWIRNGSSWVAANLWSSSWYWTCDEAYWNWYSYYWLISSSMFTKVGNARNYWYLVRPFKDIPVVPSGTWTTLYAWIWNAWIFHNATDWLISISSDWETRITIADKNVWATTVYNDWDTLSEANCWNFFQRWNNYWFPRTWSVTTSATSIDLTNYWPWNYYSSSTFITASPLDSSNNKDLRWWETWITKKWNVIEVYQGTTKIRPV